MLKSRSENPDRVIRQGLSALVVVSTVLLLVLPALPLSAQPLGWATGSCGTGGGDSSGSGDDSSGSGTDDEREEDLDTWDDGTINGTVRTGPGAVGVFFHGLRDLTHLLLSPWGIEVGVVGGAEHPG